jgi:ERCC4-type nuclease
MISIDSRTGSKELAPLFEAHGAPVRITTLEYGDLAWEGKGPTGLCSVCVERKVIGDLIDSMQSRRLSGHQLPGMAETYDYAYLIVEGIWRPGVDGAIQIGRGSLGEASYGGRWAEGYGRQLQYSAIDNYLATLELHAGMIFRRTMCADETVQVVRDLYSWWTDKAWADHSSHLAVYAPANVPQGKSRLNMVARDPSLCEKWAMQLTGIDKKAQVVASHFGSARIMANATKEQWMQIKGIGKGIANQAVREINAPI